MPGAARREKKGGDAAVKRIAPSSMGLRPCRPSFITTKCSLQMATTATPAATGRPGYARAATKASNAWALVLPGTEPSTSLRAVFSSTDR